MEGCFIGWNLGLKLWGFLLLFLLFLLFLCFCLGKCFSMIWMIDDSALYIECQSRVWRYA